MSLPLSPSPIITLLTDFGLQDSYVGQLKGVLYAGYPEVQVVDITHAVPSWGITEGAVTLGTSYHYFPQGTLHLAIVDPGVGTARDIILAEGQGHRFIAPDNGLLSWLTVRGELERVYRFTPRTQYRATSNTFHGRDIMAPLATAWLRGASPESLGTESSPCSLVVLDFTVQPATEGMVEGEVLSIDKFGNLRTTVLWQAEAFSQCQYVEVKGQRIDFVGTTYGEVGQGELLVLPDSAGFLEIAANQAKANELLNCARGDRVSVQFFNTK